MLVESVTISRRDFDAALFDLDGVLTETTPKMVKLNSRLALPPMLSIT